MDDEAMARLTADIKTHGLQNPIVLFEDKILDGIQRQEACKRAGVEPIYSQFTLLSRVIVKAGPKSYVDSQNFHRRHLTKSQQVERIDKELRKAASTDSVTVTRSVTRDAQTGQVQGSTKNHTGKVIEQAKEAGISESTVKKVLSKLTDVAKSAVKPRKERKKEPQQPIEPEPVYTGSVSQLQVKGDVQRDVKWWAAECNLAQAHLELARKGLAMAKAK
jgi:hypothetical protein